MKLLIVQPYLTKYRLDLFKEIKRKSNKILIISSRNKNYNYGLSNIKIIKNIFLKRIEFLKFYYQSGIIKNLNIFKPDKIFIAADFRSFSYWTVLFYCRLFTKKTKIYSHGQGLFKKNRNLFFYKFLFNFCLFFSEKYICYNEYVLKDLKNKKIISKKICYLNNTIIKKKPYNIKKKIINKSFLFIGRLRENTNIIFFIKCLKILSEKYNINFKFEIIGDGLEKFKIKNIIKHANLNIKLHGQIYDERQIKKISRKFTFGIFPGDAGLSIVNYMSLGMIPIVHSNISKHGPEVSYIRENFNGLYFKRNDRKSLIKTLLKINKLNKKKINYLRKNSISTFKELNQTKMSDKLLKILQD